jgi:hypothetical protein
MLKAFVSFFNELSIERETMLIAFVSFFNEISIEKRNYNLFFSWKEKLSLDHGFQEDNSLEGHHVKGQKLGHGFQEIFTGWKKNALEGTHVEGRSGVRRSGSNSPTEEITMSTTRSKSSLKLKSWEITPHN